MAMNDIEQSDNRLISERIKPFEDALELLYISGNLGGRIKFAQEWAVPAQYILGEELIRMDLYGTNDKQRRSVLENEAEERRAGLLETIVSIEKKSSDRGALNIDYVRDIIHRYGRTISLFLYTPNIVDKIMPPVEGEQDIPVMQQKMPGSSADYEIAEHEITIGAIPQQPMMKDPIFESEEREKESAGGVDHMDEIMPISVEQPVTFLSSEPVKQEEAPVPPLRPSSPVAPVAHQSSPSEGADGDESFVPKAFERVEPEDEAPPPGKRAKLKIFGIKENKSE
jgi:hypothetical protein